MENIETPDHINTKEVEKVALSIERCMGNYAFLLGAGTSREAGIETAGELIEKWKKQEHNRKDPEENKENWVEKIEQNPKNIQSKYGFWFEKSYTTREERRQFIKKTVKGVDPTFEHIVISSLMEQGYVPITLTPNFDDLIYDAFYLYLEERPFLVDHNAIAPQFKITREESMIVKLHGDYLYDNLQNTSEETSELKENINDVLQRTLGEYGLVVLGYSGRDKSIMNVLNSEEFEIPDQGLYWCTINPNDLSSQVKELLKKDNTFLVEIESSLDFFYKLYENLEDLSVPTPVDIRERADKRSEQLEDGIINVGGKEVLGLAREYVRRDEYDNALDLLTESIDQNGEDIEIFRQRAFTYKKKSQYDQAINDYSSAVELIEEELSEAKGEKIEEIKRRKAVFKNKIALSHFADGNYDDAIDFLEQVVDISDGETGFALNLAEGLILSGDIEEGISKCNEIIENTDDVEYESNCWMLIAIGKILSGKNYQDELESIKNIVDDEMMGAWDFKELNKYMENEDISEDKKEKIEEIIELQSEGYSVETRIPDQ